MIGTSIVRSTKKLKMVLWHPFKRAISSQVLPAKAVETSLSTAKTLEVEFPKHNLLLAILGSNLGVLFID